MHPTHRLATGTRPQSLLIGYDWDHTLPGQDRLYLHWQTAQGYVTEVRDSTTAEALALPLYLGPWGIVVRGQWLVDSKEREGHYVPFGQGLVWTGASLPANRLPLAASLSLPQTFLSGRPVTRDLVISLRLIGYEADGSQWAWTDLNDGIPALGAIPTLKWIEGSQVRSPYTLKVGPAAYPGQAVGATLRLYDAFTNRPLPILDERITAQFPWVPLGATAVAKD
jgi:hypothetical protein